MWSLNTRQRWWQVREYKYMVSLYFIMTLQMMMTMNTRMKLVMMKKILILTIVMANQGIRDALRLHLLALGDHY